MGIVAETNFFGNFKHFEDPKALIIPVPYEFTPSYLKGTKNGPQAILNASIKLEKFDDEMWLEPSNIGISTSNFVTCEFAGNNSIQPFNEIEQVVRNAVISGALPVVIGGEACISYGSVKAIYDLYPELSILYFDACASLKDVSQNSKYSSKCVLRRVLEVMPDIKIIQVGTRSISKEEADYLEGGNTNINIFFARDKDRWNIAEILSSLTKNIYIHFNFNVLDCGIMPSVVSPEPGGLSFEQTVEVIKNVCAFKDIVGMSFVDFCPNPNLQAPDFLASKLIYKSVGYTFARQLGVFDETREITEKEEEQVETVWSEVQWIWVFARKI